MYGQGNFAPQFGQRPHTSMPPIQQCPPAPPTRPFQQGPAAPRPPVVQGGPPSVPPHGGAPVYLQVPSASAQHGPPAPLPSSGMLSSGQSHLTPPPPPQVHGSDPMSHSYSTAQQSSQWTQNMYHIPPPVPPPRVLPPPPSQGQALYRGPVHISPPGGVLSLQHTPSPPPPPPTTSSFFAPAPFGSFIQSAPQESHMPPPPPPSSPPGPPPLPLSSPPPTSPPPCFGTPSTAPLLAASDMPHHSESVPSPNLHPGFEVMASDSVDRVLAPHQISDDTLSNHEGGTGCEVGSIVEDGLPSGENLNLDLPPPLLKPAEEKIVRNIEVLCQYIAKNGPGFEDMTRRKEFGNPEFEFLFGGEPGSEAAASHEYFVWMKKKCSLACKLLEEQQHNVSPLRSSGIGSPLQPDILEAGVSVSPADSDMDMEDDITQPDEGQWSYKSLESLNDESVLITNTLDKKQQLHASQSSAEENSAKDARSEPTLSPDQDHSTFGRPLARVGSSVMNPVGAVECPSDSNVDKSIHAHEDMSQSNASAAVAGVNSENFSTQLIKGTSPFRLLQDYASDDGSDDDEPCLVDVSPATVSQSVKAGDAIANVDGDMDSYFLMGMVSKRLSESEKGLGPFSENVLTCSLSMPSKSLESFIELQRDIRENDTTSTTTVKSEQLVDNGHGNQESIDSGTSHEAFHQKNALGGDSVAAATESGQSSQKEDAKYTSVQLKVDEFGRLVREDPSDSDSGDLHYGRRATKRGRSPSRSPHERRRRRSPWRRKDKRSRSRSWSPHKRSSRSKSPSFSRGSEFGADKTRRDKGQLPDCFDFQRGKCYRGAFCRYLHHDSDKSDGSRHYKRMLPNQEVTPSSKSSERSVHEHDKVKSQEMQLYQDVPGCSIIASKDGNTYQKVVVSATNAGQPVISFRHGESLITCVAESERVQGVTAQMQKKQDVKEKPVEPTHHLPENENCLDAGNNLQLVDSLTACLVTDDAKKLPGDTSHGMPSSIDSSVIQQSQANISDPVRQNDDSQSQQMDNSSASDSSPVQTSATLPRELSPCVPCYPSQLPLPLLSVSHGTDAPFPPQVPGDYNTMPPTAIYPSHSASLGTCPPRQAPLPYQHSLFPVPPNSSWNCLPPPPPRVSYVNYFTMNVPTAPQGVPLLQFQQNQLPQRNDFSSQTFLRPSPTELPTHSQVGEVQHRIFAPLQEPDQPLLRMEELRRRALPMSNLMGQQFGGPGLVRKDHFTRLPLQALISSNSFAQGNMQPQPMPFSRESPPRRMQSFSGDNLLTGELTPSFQSHPHLQQPSFGLQPPAADSVSMHLREPGNINSTMARYTSDFDRNQPSCVSDCGGSRISNYCNPYASTFDQPLSSNYSLNVFNRQRNASYSNKYGAPFNLSRVPVDGGFGSFSSRNMTSSPNSGQAVEKILPRTSSDQYDPLFDSIEPSSPSFRKSDHGQKHETTDDSDIMLRLSGSNEPLDVEENNKQKDAGAIAVTTLLDNDEYGETADAEVGAVENGSPSDPIDVADAATGEIAIDQVKTPGKSKKSKDSRSMKLFKVALANFVKEVLKPSWRRGNMSKEAFKTIVKKTVDKVFGAMKSHHIPKSQTKIEQYIDSSQRKLTKLVMGYVDKYVNG